MQNKLIYLYKSTNHKNTLLLVTLLFVKYCIHIKNSVYLEGITPFCVSVLLYPGPIDPCFSFLTNIADCITRSAVASSSGEAVFLFNIPFCNLYIHKK